MFQGDKLLYSELTKHVGLTLSLCLCHSVFMNELEVVYLCV